MKFSLWHRGSAPAAVQIARRSALPAPSPGRGELRRLRQQVPLIDAALDKLVRLMGTFTVRCEDPAVEQELARFLSRVETGAGRQGLRGFLESYLSDLLTYGGAVGEMLPAPDGRGLAAVVNCPGEAVTVRPAEDGPGLRFYAGPDGLPGREVPYPELILFTPLDPAAGEVWGRSLLEGLEGPAAVLETIFRSMRANFERAGSLRYAVTYRPAAGDPTDPEEAAKLIAREWRAAMDTPPDTVSDFVAVGDVQVRVIGADGPVLDTETPVRQLLEQIVAKLGVPPFLLGLHWSTTERMSTQQADLLTSELERYRALLTPVIRRILDTHLRLLGRGVPFSVEWEAISLQDAGALAAARYDHARAAELESRLPAGPKAAGAAIPS